MSARLMRGLPPLATALAVASGSLLSAAVPAAPARAALATSLPVAATPGLASEWWLTALGVPQAWRESGIPRAKPGAGVTVAVLSTGVDATYPDLAGYLSGGLAAASPASAAPVASLAGTHSPRASDSGAAREARSVLRDVAIGVGILIAALTAALALARSRRRHVGHRRQPGHRQDARQQAGSGAGSARNSGGVAAVAGSFSALGSHGTHAARRGNSAGGKPASDTATIGSQRVVGGTQAAVPAPPQARPRMTGVPRSGTLGSMGRPARARATSDAPPWAPAWLPEAPEALAFPPADGADPALQQPEAAQPAVRDATIPPWERVTGQLAAAPLSADVPAWPKVNTGPMYVWNPATNSGPFPAAGQQAGEPGQRSGPAQEPPPPGEVWWAQAERPGQPPAGGCPGRRFLALRRDCRGRLRGLQR